MKSVVLSISLISCGLLQAAADSDSSRATSGSGSERDDSAALQASIYRPSDSTRYLASHMHALPGARFNVQGIGTTLIDHERCSMMAIVDDTIGPIESLVHERINNMPVGAHIWNDMKQVLVDLVAPATDAALILANQSSLYLYVKGMASKILVIWPDGMMEMAAAIERHVDPAVFPFNADIRRIVLLRGIKHSSETIKTILDSALLKDAAVKDVVNAIMPPDEDTSAAVAVFDCKHWIADSAQVQPVVRSTGQPVRARRAKTLKISLLRLLGSRWWKEKTVADSQ